jgi:large subunit ribosomal protein L28
VAKVCAICGKKKHMGLQVSHSHIGTKRAWRPNIQRVRILVNGAPQRANVCTRCLRSGKVQRAL